MRIMILGASYGSLLATKLLMAGHDVTLICRAATAALINREGTQVRLKLRDEDSHRTLCSGDYPGRLDAAPPEAAAPPDYDLIALAMQEPQYSAAPVGDLLRRVAAHGVPCLSLMNMPPPPYLKRIEALRDMNLDACFDEAAMRDGIWDGFDPENITLSSPDPQAFRPPEEAPNILHVGLPTNFKAADFSTPHHSRILHRLADDIAAVTLDGKDVPVKLRVHSSLFVPLAKWSMLLTGNYRCVMERDVRSIRDAVHGDLAESRALYGWVDGLAQRLGADPADQVPFEKYATAALSLQKPSSAARAIVSGAERIERVDRLVREIGRQLGMQNAAIDRGVAIVDARLVRNGMAADAADAAMAQAS